MIAARIVIAGGSDDGDADTCFEKGEETWDYWIRGGEGGAVFVEGDVPVEGDEFEGGGDGEELSGVEGEADVVEGGGDEAARGDAAAGVLIGEGGGEGEGGEEVADCRDEMGELGAVLG